MDANCIIKLSNFENNSSIKAGVAFKIGNDGMHHCGIAYRRDNKTYLLHLEWHYKLTQVVLPFEEENNYFFIIPDIVSERQTSISAMCRKIFERNSRNKIPYGLVYKGGIFNKAGVWLSENGECGFTCATFVLAVFKSCGFNLINIVDWPKRPDDLIFHTKILTILHQQLLENKVTNEHYNNISQEFGCARFRPEEVAVSSSIFTKSSSHEVIISTAMKFLELVNNYRN